MQHTVADHAAVAYDGEDSVHATLPESFRLGTTECYQINLHRVDLQHQHVGPWPLGL